MAFFPIRGRSIGYWLLLATLTLLIIAGLVAAHYMESEGHRVTGMTNRVVWGVPHVFAVFLIMAASGALHVASISSVFGRSEYQPLARLSGLLAITLLLGGLAVLVLDLGRPDRLIVAMTTFHFRSIFAWNIFLYTGFMVVVIAYLWMMFESRMNRYIRGVGIFAFAWRLILTTGTGSIFGVLVAREAYAVMTMVPLFILHSLSLGTAIYLLVLVIAFHGTRQEVDMVLVGKLGRLLAWLVLAVLSVVVICHLSNIYVARHPGVERFILLDGSVYPLLFWGFQIFLGSLVPVFLLFRNSVKLPVLVVSASLVVVGGLAQIYVIIIGGQAYPLSIFPGYEVESGGFVHQVATYLPSLPEFGLGFGGVAFSLLLTVFGLRLLPFLPAEKRRAIRVN